MTLSEIHEEMKTEGKDISDTISNLNIDDILWYARSKGITELSISRNQCWIIWSFLASNIGDNDTEMRREYFIEGKVPRCLGIDFILT